MTERDFKILQKISSKQAVLSSLINKYKIKSHSDLGDVDEAVRRGFIGLVSDIFELTKPLSNNTKTLLPFNMSIMKQFRNTSTHQYDMLTNIFSLSCINHCIDKEVIKAINKIIDDYNK